jgi:hypothetical protein
VVARDTLNPRNYHSIKVEVTPIVSLKWLEDHSEVKKNVEEVTLNLIAFDKNGRKFTNCTNIEVSFDLKGAGILSPLPTSRKYGDITVFAAKNRELLALKQRFDENPNANFIQDLKTPVITQESVYLHNNFGICS